MSLRRCFASIVFGLLVAASAHATDLTVVGLFPSKALVQINGGSPQTLSIGQTVQGVLLVAVDPDSATFDVDGKRTKLGMGQARAGSSSATASLVLTPDSHGYFVVDALVNAKPVRLLVDTGATMIALPSGDARRLGIDYQKGQPATMQTANGSAPVYRIKLDTVRVGNVTVDDVDAVVVEDGGLPRPLLGMSFLNRVDMKREGDVMTLTKRR